MDDSRDSDNRIGSNFGKVANLDKHEAGTYKIHCNGESLKHFIIMQQGTLMNASFNSFGTMYFTELHLIQ